MTIDRPSQAAASITDEQHRRTQVGSTLLGLLADWFVAHGARRICVDVGDDASRPFYRRHGAVELNKHWMVWDDVGAAR